MHAIDRADVIDATNYAEILDINNETGEIKQAVKKEQQTRVEFLLHDLNKGDF